MNEAMLNEFNQYLKAKKNFSDNTIKSYDRDLKKLFIYLEECGYEPSEYVWLNEQFVSEYISYLKEEKFSASTLARTVSAIHIFADYLYKENFIDSLASIKVKISKDTKEDMVIFTREEIAHILDIDASTLNDYRDKAIFELSYSIGIKPTECINLTMKDLNLEIGYLKYRTKDGYRTIPLNIEAINAIKCYLEELKKTDWEITEKSKLFLNQDGEGISRQGFWKIFKKRQQELKLDKELNTTNFRNSLAVHMIEDRIPVEEVQEILGLKNVSSLKFYFKNLKKNKNIKKTIANHPRKTMR